MQNTQTLITASIVFLGLFLVLSFADGIYLHLIYYRLPENSDSRFEHLMHTVRAILFIPIVVMLFLLNVSGTALWLVTGIVLIDLAFEAVDVLEERRSRMRLGGLMSGEYLLHILETTLRIAALAFAYAAKPTDAWWSEMVLVRYPVYVQTAATIFTAGSVLVAILHLALIPFPFFISKVLGNFGRMRTV